MNGYLFIYYMNEYNELIKFHHINNERKKISKKINPPKNPRYSLPKFKLLTSKLEKLS